MRIFVCRMLFGFGVVWLLTMAHQPALGQDCNGNGIQDSLRNGGQSPVFVGTIAIYR